MLVLFSSCFVRVLVFVTAVVMVVVYRLSTLCRCMGIDEFGLENGYDWLATEDKRWRKVVIEGSSLLLLLVVVTGMLVGLDCGGRTFSIRFVCLFCDFTRIVVFCLFGLRFIVFDSRIKVGWGWIYY